jgi:hypothetical protein
MSLKSSKFVFSFFFWQSMSFCVPEWGTRTGGMLNAVTSANYYPQLAPKGRGDSIRHQKPHLPDLASV